MVEDIITALSRFKSLFVIARNSSFTYKGKAVDIKQVGRELGVRYVLEGSVRKAGNRVRITGQLIEAGNGQASLGGPVRRRARRRVRPAGPGDEQRRRPDCAEARAGRDRAGAAQADREAGQLRLLLARHGAGCTRGHSLPRRVPFSPGPIERDPEYGAAYAMAAVDADVRTERSSGVPLAAEERAEADPACPPGIEGWQATMPLRWPGRAMC